MSEKNVVFSLPLAMDVFHVECFSCKALVYYVKARLAEDGANLEVKEYFMREFREILEKHESGKIRGPRVISPGSHSIR